MNSKITVERLNKLCTMLNSYGHRWSETPSNRMYDWVSEYNQAKGSPVWYVYCEKYGFTFDHDAHDCMA